MLATEGANEDHKVAGRRVGFPPIVGGTTDELPQCRNKREANTSRKDQKGRKIRQMSRAEDRGLEIHGRSDHDKNNDHEQ